jgi:Nitric oxide reductase activation protein
MKAHSKIRKMIEGKKSGISNRQFFTSPSFSAHLSDIAKAQTKRYGIKRPIKASIYWKPKESFIAATDDFKIVINAGNKSVTSQTGLENRYYMILGLFTHELGHLLYSDFLSRQTYMHKLQSSIWFPHPPKTDTSRMSRNEAEIFSFCSKEEKNKKAFIQIALDLQNRLEDGYIENRLLNRFPGKLGHALSFQRKSIFDEMHNLTQLKDLEEDESHIYRTMSTLILSYAKFGMLKYGDEPLGDKRVQLLFSLLDDIDMAVTSNNPLERMDITNIIIVKLWPHIKAYIEQLEDVEDMESFMTTTLAGNGSTVPGKGKSVPVETDSDDDDSENLSASSKNRKMTAALAGDSSGPPAEESGDSSGETQEIQEGESGRISPHNTDSLNVPIGGTTEWDDNYGGASYPNAGKDIERILDKVAESHVLSTLEEERKQELNELAQQIEYGDIHAGVNKTIRRMSTVSEELKESFFDAAVHLLPISKRLQKTVKHNLQDKRKGGKMTGLYLGRRIDVHALPRRDGRVFYKNNLPNDTPEITVGLLLDESGSMCACDRATYARATAIILHDFCNALQIPVMIYGHSTGSGVDLYSYAEFDTIDQNDKFRLMDISARSSNRDGAALRYMMERIKKRPEEVKLLIIVSDGQPADAGYGGSEAEADLRGIAKECEKNGVLLVAAAIGSDKENINRIYGDAFMDITDLNQMPIKLAEKIKKYIRT